MCRELASPQLATTLIFNLATMLCQHQPQCCHKVVTTLLYQLGRILVKEQCVIHQHRSTAQNRISKEKLKK